MEILRQHIFGSNPHDIYIIGDVVMQGADIESVRQGFAAVTIPQQDIMPMLAKLQAWAGVGYAAEDLTDIVKANAVRLAEDYYNGDSVSDFTYGGVHLWTDFTNRQKLRMRLEAEKEAGMTDTVVWYESHRFDLPISATQRMLTAVELYASKCFDTFNKHKLAITAMTDAQTITEYDYTADYPAKLSF